MDLAEVLRFAERKDESAPIIDEAIALYEVKGNVVSGGRARRLREELDSVRR